MHFESKTRRNSVWLIAMPATLLASALFVLPAAYAGEDNETGCYYDDVLYAEGTVMCHGDQKVRCDDGAWGDIGLCEGDETEATQTLNFTPSVPNKNDLATDGNRRCD
jgi:hypothetical protein